MIKTLCKRSVVTEKIQQLLILQDRNSNVTNILTEILRIPVEVKKLQNLIQQEKEEANTKKAEVQALEVERKRLELEVDTAEEQISKYKNQQIQVKKNDEYKALTLQIEQAQEKIDELETAELELMEKIDSASEELKTVEAEVQKRVEYQEGLIQESQEKLKRLESQLSGAKDEYQAQVEKCDPKNISMFDLLKTQIKRPPYIVDITEQNCGGCHMRVSNDILKKAKMGEIAKCDQCARIVYFDV